MFFFGGNSDCTTYILNTKEKQELAIDVFLLFGFCEIKARSKLFIHLLRLSNQLYWKFQIAFQLQRLPTTCYWLWLTTSGSFSVHNLNEGWLARPINKSCSNQVWKKNWTVSLSWEEICLEGHEQPRIHQDKGPPWTESCRNSVSFMDKSHGQRKMFLEKSFMLWWDKDLSCLAASEAYCQWMCKQ